MASFNLSIFLIFRQDLCLCMAKCAEEEYL